MLTAACGRGQDTLALQQVPWPVMHVCSVNACLRQAGWAGNDSALYALASAVVSLLCSYLLGPLMTL